MYTSLWNPSLNFILIFSTNIYLYTWKCTCIRKRKFLIRFPSCLKQLHKVYMLFNIYEFENKSLYKYLRTWERKKSGFWNAQNFYPNCPLFIHPLNNVNKIKKRIYETIGERRKKKSFKVVNTLSFVTRANPSHRLFINTIYGGVFGFALYIFSTFSNAFRI